MNYVRCIDNTDYEVSLSIGQVYKTIPDNSDQVSLRVIDNEGEDYLYDASRFESVEFSGDPSEAAITVHLPQYLKGVLHAEALAAKVLGQDVGDHVDIGVRFLRMLGSYYESRRAGRDQPCLFSLDPHALQPKRIRHRPASRQNRGL